MSTDAFARVFLEKEARAMRARLDRIAPLSLSMTMVPAANVSTAALTQIERVIRDGRSAMERALAAFTRWLDSPAGRGASAADMQRRFTLLRLRFHAMISRYDLFSDVLVQRSERENGVWIAGLDDLAADALRPPGFGYPAPPVVCYLDQGLGAAIRRARTRLPGGTRSPVSIIRVPRERMVGQSIGASLLHEVGHEAASLLGLVPRLRAALDAEQRRAASPMARLAWSCWERWCSEAIADVWSVAHLGVSATFGLIGVVSLPRPFVFRVDLTDPHPFPWIRVLLSVAIGHALYPDGVWDWVERMWKSMYPLVGLNPEVEQVCRSLESSLGACARVLLSVRSPVLSGEMVGRCLARLQRSPQRLSLEWEAMKSKQLDAVSPTLALATVSQAGVDRRLTPEQESALVGRLLTAWAFRSSLAAAERCAVSRAPTRPAFLSTHSVTLA
jgi:hypothetical protein